MPTEFEADVLEFMGKIDERTERMDVAQQVLFQKMDENDKVTATKVGIDACTQACKESDDRVGKIEKEMNIAKGVLYTLQFVWAAILAFFTYKKGDS